MVEGDGFGEIVREELQREVYRRRRVMYELENVPRVVTARPEMILVIHDAVEGDLRVPDLLQGAAAGGSRGAGERRGGIDSILELRSDPDPIVRLISEKVEEFHIFRSKLSEGGAPAPERRVFYANEL